MNILSELARSKKIKYFPTKLVLLSTRKVYKPKFNIKESELSFKIQKIIKIQIFKLIFFKSKKNK